MPVSLPFSLVSFPFTLCMQNLFALNLAADVEKFHQYENAWSNQEAFFQNATEAMAFYEGAT